jgi:crotonobetainyl-CoA:carnitine CoA-transferase CaiB-like acyl-CoA transferase
LTSRARRGWLSPMLEDLRVLDLTDESGFLAGKILGELGADVIKIEPPGGDRRGRRGPFLAGIADPEPSLVWPALNTSNHGIVLDLGVAGRWAVSKGPRIR